MGRPDGVENLDQLLARRILVPGAVAPHQFEQFLDGGLGAALAVEGDGQIETRLMVVGVGFQAPPEGLGVARPAALLGKLQGGDGGRHLALLAQRLGQAVDRRAALRQVAGGDQTADHPGDGAGMGRVLRQNLGEDAAGARRVAGLQRLAAGLQDRLDGRLGTAGQAVDEAFDLAFGNGAGEAVDRAPLAEAEHRGHRLDVHLRGQLAVLVDVDPDQTHQAAGLAHRLFEGRAQGLAGAAPGGPEIDDDGNLHRRLDDVGDEGVGGAVLDEVPAASRRRGGRWRRAGVQNECHGRFTRIVLKPAY